MAKFDAETCFAVSEERKRFLPRLVEARREAAEKVVALADERTARTPPRARFSIDWFDDIEEAMPKESVIDGVFAVNEFTSVSGKPGSGKSAILTDACCHVAAGMDWHGRKVRQGLVVYIAAERKDLTKRRMLAFRKKHRIGKIPLLILGGKIDLTSGLRDAEEIVAAIKRAEDACGYKCVLIVIDTLTRVFGPGDQNTSRDMTKFVQSCDEVRSGLDGPHVAAVHHTGWAGDRGKGAIDLDGAVDASFLVKKQANSYVLECDGANDGLEGLICSFNMESVEIGVDRNGAATTAPVCYAVDLPVSQAANLADSVNSVGMLLDIVKVLTADGEERVGKELVRQAFYEKHVGKGDAKSRTAFNKAIKKLVDQEAMTDVEGYFSASLPSEPANRTANRTRTEGSLAS